MRLIPLLRLLPVALVLLASPAGAFAPATPSHGAANAGAPDEFEDLNRSLFAKTGLPESAYVRLPDNEMLFAIRKGFLSQMARHCNVEGWRQHFHVYAQWQRQRQWDDVPMALLTALHGHGMTSGVHALRDLKCEPEVVARIGEHLNKSIAELKSWPFEATPRQRSRMVWYDLGSSSRHDPEMLPVYPVSDPTRGVLALRLDEHNRIASTWVLRLPPGTGMQDGKPAGSFSAQAWRSATTPEARQTQAALLAQSGQLNGRPLAEVQQELGPEDGVFERTFDYPTSKSLPLLTAPKPLAAP
ncbi:MAG: hypothetical protein H7831_04580 [Magnetococcus sp. WYHC-3]